MNGEILTNRLMRGARRMLGELPPDPKSLFNAPVAGRYAAAARLFDADISRRVEALADRRRHRLERAGTRAAGLDRTCS